MSLHSAIPDKDDPRWTRRGGLHVRRFEGVHRWNSGDTYTIKVTAAQTGGSLGFIEGTVPPGGGPAAHAHSNEDEAFYLLSGDLEFLNGDETFIAGPGDVVFIPRGNRHRFKNVGLHSAHILFLFTPGGQEGYFVETGDEPTPGEPPTTWGPEKYKPLLKVIEKYGNTPMPEN
jgi:quercetin dioxygenase-like cupin family protein